MMLFQLNGSGKTILYYSRYIVRVRRKNPKQKQIVQPTQKERKEKKRKKTDIAQRRSSHFFLIFPFLILLIVRHAYVYAHSAII